MWHYTEGITNYDPIWPLHGIRILPGPSSLWLDATGKRLPSPLYPGFDTLGTLEYIAQTGQDYTWFVLNARIIAKEFALSGQEQNPDLTGAQRARRAGPGAAGRARAGAGVRRQGRRLRQRKLVAGLGVRDERRARRRCRSTTPPSRPRSPRATARWPTGSPRTARSTAIRGGAQLPRRPGHPRRRPAPADRPEGRPADRGQAAHPDPEVVGRLGNRPRLTGAARPTAACSTGCTRRVRPPDSAAAACTATARWRARSSAAACSPAGRRAGPRRATR